MRWSDFNLGDRVRVLSVFARTGECGVVAALLDFSTESASSHRVQVRLDEDGALLDFACSLLRPLDVVEQLAELA